MRQGTRRKASTWVRHCWRTASSTTVSFHIFFSLLFYISKPNSPPSPEVHTGVLPNPPSPTTECSLFHNTLPPFWSLSSYFYLNRCLSETTPCLGKGLHLLIFSCCNVCAIFAQWLFLTSVLRAHCPILCVHAKQHTWLAVSFPTLPQNSGGPKPSCI